MVPSSAPSPEPLDELLSKADTKRRFALMLCEIGRSRGNGGGVIAAKSGLARSTVYRMLNPQDVRFPRSVENVEKYCHGCNLSPTETAQVVALWHRLNGTTVTLIGATDTGEAVIEAELVDMDDKPAVRSEAELRDADPTGIKFGNVRGDVTINLTRHEVPMDANAGLVLTRVLLHSIFRASGRDKVRALGVAGFAVWIIFWMVLGLKDPGLASLLAPFLFLPLLLVTLLLLRPMLEPLLWVGSAVDRPKKRRSRSGIVRQLLGWPGVIALTFSSIAATFVGLEHAMAADYPDRDFVFLRTSATSVLSLLIVTLAWMLYTDWSAVRLMATDIPVMFVLPFMLGALTAAGLSIGADLVPLAVVSGVLVWGAALLLLEKFIAQSVLADQLEHRRTPE